MRIHFEHKLTRTELLDKCVLSARIKLFGVEIVSISLHIKDSSDILAFLTCSRNVEVDHVCSAVELEIHLVQLDGRVLEA